MTKQVNIIGEFNTSMGHIITVKGDSTYNVGQKIIANGKTFTIIGINMVYSRNVDVVGLIVIDKTAS